MEKYRRMKDIVTDITGISLDSDIDVEILCEKVDEYRCTGMTYEEAVDLTRQRFRYGEKIKKAFKDMAEAIEELTLIAKATKYRHDDLVTIMREQIEDGDSIERAFQDVRDISLEYDW